MRQLEAVALRIPTPFRSQNRPDRCMAARLGASISLAPSEARTDPLVAWWRPSLLSDSYLPRRPTRSIASTCLKRALCKRNPLNKGEFMKPLFRVLLACVLGLSSCGRDPPPPQPVDGAEDGLSDESGADLDRLRENSSIPLQIRFRDGIVASAHFKIPASLEKDPVLRALDFLGDYPELYRIDGDKDLHLERLSDDEDGSHVFFGQLHEGLPVFHGGLSVHIVHDQVVGTSGAYLTEFPENRKPTVLAKDAAGIALQALILKQPMLSSEPRLGFYNDGLISEERTSTHLVWRVFFEGQKDGINSVWASFVDADNGDILSSWNTTLNDGKDFDIETANNTTSDTCWNIHWETDDDEWFSEEGDTGYPGRDHDAFHDGLHAFRFAHDTYDYYWDTFRRRSWDGDDEQVEVMVHLGDNNAYYDSGCEHLKFGDGWVTRDLFGHEFTHGVVYHTAGLVYRDQPGALNESYADVFGTIMDNNWEMGEDLPGGAIRDLSNPPLHGQPDHLDNRALPPVERARNKHNDFGGVHTNSGIPNKVAYLLMDGGLHNGYEIDAMGRDKVGVLFYKTLKNRLGSSSQFFDARDATVYMADILR